jgi:putative membrane-bound dehydrogenase-like protein
MVLLAAIAPAVRGQGGDRAGDIPQVASPVARSLPPAPPLSAEQQQATFKLPPGFRIDLVAAEPLVHEPVAMAFDLQGALWVAEMSGYNSPIIEDAPALATGEATKWITGKVVKLEDTDGDGRMDKRTVFLDDLDSPRALAVVRGGILVADPPNLWFARDTNGDGKCDERILIADDYGPKGAAEGAANGLLWGRDNWIHNISGYRSDFRRHAGEWQRGAITPRGQFGISQDDYGRLFHNRNSDQLRVDLFSPLYGARNPGLTDIPWMNTLAAKDQTVWPSRPTPGVNRGYRPYEPGKPGGILREDGTLAEFTAACSPYIYRGANFPAEFYNNAFVPEPSANLIKRNLLHEVDARITATNAYQGVEFLTSADERFRPVALTNTPAGDLYIADLYRGVLQEARMITSYLRDQVLMRKLQSPMFGLGRIWRVRYAAGPVETRQPALEKASTLELARTLVAPNAWWRDTAQQAIVERGDRSVASVLETMAREEPLERTRVYALWTLEGLEALTPRFLGQTLKDDSPKVRAAAVRLHEGFLRGAEAERAVTALAPLARDPAAEVVIQLALSLGEAKIPSALGLMAEVLVNSSDAFVPKAIATGLGGREALFLDLLAARPTALSHPSAIALLGVLGSAIAAGGQKGDVERLIERIGDQSALPESARLALLGGMETLTRPAVRRAVAPGAKLQPAMLAPLTSSSNGAVRARALKLAASLAQAEKDVAAAGKKAVVLNAEQTKTYEAGKEVFALCAACHQPTGTGLPGLAPALVDSQWVAGTPELLIRILLNGKEGTPGFPGTMPPVALSNEQVAAVLTYVRNSWGMHFGAVEASTVDGVRKATARRSRPWTDAELRYEEGPRAAAPKTPAE